MNQDFKWDDGVIADFLSDIDRGIIKTSEGGYYGAIKKFKASKQNPLEYEILSVYIDQTPMFPIKPIYPINGMIRLLIGRKNEYAQTIDDCLNKNECVKIFSVKRISDNCIFSIGDKTKQGKVRSFLFEDKKYLTVTLLSELYPFLIVMDFSGLQKAEPKKQHILVTEDKVEIFEGDKYWYVSSDFECIEPHTCFKTDITGIYIGKFLSTKEAAEEYANKHRPCFSVQDINDCLSDEFVFPSLRKEILQKATELAKSKNK